MLHFSGKSFLKIGMIFAVSNLVGNRPVENERLIIPDNGLAISVLTNLRIFNGPELLFHKISLLSEMI